MIWDFLTPSNITDMWSLFRLINQVGYCMSNSAELLSLTNPFYWNETLDDALDYTK
jgi:hypothetical protein